MEKIPASIRHTSWQEAEPTGIWVSRHHSNGDGHPLLKAYERSRFLTLDTLYWRCTLYVSRFSPSSPAHSGSPGHRLKSLPPTPSPQSHLFTLALAPLSPITDLATSFSLVTGLSHEPSTTPFPQLATIQPCWATWILLRYPSPSNSKAQYQRYKPRWSCNK